MPDSPSPAPSLEDHRRPGSHPSSHRSSSVSSSPAHTESSSDRIRRSPFSTSKCCGIKWNITFSFSPPLFQRFTTMACPWTTPCSACPPTFPLGPKRETWPTTWVTKQRHTKGFTLTKVRFICSQCRSSQQLWCKCSSGATKFIQLVLIHDQICRLNDPYHQVVRYFLWTYHRWSRVRKWWFHYCCYIRCNNVYDTFHCIHFIAGKFPTKGHDMITV